MFEQPNPISCSCSFCLISLHAHFKKPSCKKAEPSSCLPGNVARGSSRGEANTKCTGCRKTPARTAHGPAQPSRFPCLLHYLLIIFYRLQGSRFLECT